ncbi:hypothetical protein EZV62_001416 [Acer yangbiense]|uniref:DUF659 domain-containing protein n=1 Tax=Acer yangbiense TaxID=1000413 RepID=A0A5C7IU11_9ROSI|nr:hypothetical protein EZV62_001416 [Acer yangbiense]
MYDAGIPFNAVKYPSFKPFCEAVGKYGMSVKLPSYHEVRVPLLKKEVELTREAMKVHEDEWKAYGFHLAVNGIRASLKMLDDDNDRDDELVFTAEDNLTWNDVATAARVEESSYRFRSRGASSSRPMVQQQSQVRPSNRLLDEEESEEEIEGEDKGDQL